MKSSSSLFPVQLISAEVLGGLAEDVYLIKPNNSPDKSVEIALSNVSVYCNKSNNHKEDDAGIDVSIKGDPIILLHGNHQNRRLWVSPQGEGLAKWLVDQGFDVWLMEARGHGLSVVNGNYHNNTLSDYARYDIPAINTFVTEQTGKKPLWLGANEGGASLALSLAAQGLKDYDVSGVVFMGAPFSGSFINKIPVLNQLTSLLRRGDCFQYSRGPEPEPDSLLREIIAEQGVFSFPGKSLGVNTWKVLQKVKCPLALLDGASQLDSKKVLNLVHQSVLTLLTVKEPGVSLAGDSIYNTLHRQQSVSVLQSLLLPWIKARGTESEVLPTGKTPSIA